MEWNNPFWTIDSILHVAEEFYCSTSFYSESINTKETARGVNQGKY